MSKISNKIIEQIINTSPLVLLTIEDEELINLANQALPYSVGFEIECSQKASFNKEAFSSIPDIMDVNVDSCEQRFRIPNGIKGLICLWNICEQLKLNSELNEGSGIHYHIDMSDVFGGMVTKRSIENNQKWILSELDSWNYKGNYNNRECKLNQRCWVQFQSEFKTAEIRIGEMSFDYNLIIKRMIHGCQIIKRFREKEGYFQNPKFQKIDKEVILNYLKMSIQTEILSLLRQLKDLQEKEKEETPISQEEMKNTIKKRTVFI